MNKKLVVKAEECIGCNLCLIYCAFAHEKTYSEKNAMLRLERDDTICRTRPVICRQCSDADCLQACPEEAITRDGDKFLVVDRNLCSGCGACVEACPFKVMMFDKEKNKAFKCDLCRGDPACVRCCPTGALLFK